MTTPMFPGRRRALALDDALEGRAPANDLVVRQLVSTVDAIRSLPTATPDHEFVTDLRIRVVAAAERELSRPRRDLGATPRRTPPHALPAWRRFGLATAASLFVLVGAGAGLTSAAAQALPGDLLYPVKRGVERVDVALDDTDAQRGQTLLTQADTRLSELRELVEGEGGVDTDQLVVDTLDTFAAQATEGTDALLAAYAVNGDAVSLQLLDGFTVRAGEKLTDLSGTLPAAADDAYSLAAGSVSDLQDQLAELCADCSSVTTVRVPTELLSAMQTLPSGPLSDSGQTFSAGGVLGGVPALQLPDLPEVDPGDLVGAGGDADDPLPEGADPGDTGTTEPGGTGATDPGDIGGTDDTGGTDPDGTSATDPDGTDLPVGSVAPGDDPAGTVGGVVDGILGGGSGGDDSGDGDDDGGDPGDTVGGIVDGVGQVPGGTPLGEVGSGSTVTGPDSDPGSGLGSGLGGVPEG